MEKGGNEELKNKSMKGTWTGRDLSHVARRQK